MKTIALLGSTGSIGRNALDLIAAHPDRYRVLALAAGQNIDLLAEQVERFSPEVVAVRDADLAGDLLKRIRPRGETEVLWGCDGTARAAALEGVDIVISAITGAAGLEPTMAAVRAGKDIALANKETLVMAGDLVMREAAERGIRVIPIDSEHSAVLQSLQGHDIRDLRRIILTASGGPFRETPIGDMAGITAAQALNHPNWDMGPKVTVDSATLMNKGLEVIEARWLFNLSMSQISVLIHPQSIIHSMAEYRDGSIMAQLGVPHMITPIAYALSCPRHLDTPIAPLDFSRISALTFEAPDLDRFRCLALALKAAEEGGGMPAVLNAANEIAVELFLKEALPFLSIPQLVERVMNAYEPSTMETIEQVLEADAWARTAAREEAGRMR
ncbi:MAG: 1-deoxy-D-xylulose-5-phosphate reductoisomerase [Thermodesulfobacteriota bacterium]